MIHLTLGSRRILMSSRTHQTQAHALFWVLPHSLRNTAVEDIAYRGPFQPHISNLMALLMTIDTVKLIAMRLI